jgi:hypothetical protein
MISKEMTKHLSTIVDIMSDKFHEEIKRCYDANPRVTMANPRLVEKVIWEHEYIDPVTYKAFPVPSGYCQQICIDDDSFVKAFNEAPEGFKFKVEWDAAARFTELDDYKNCYVECTNFRISVIADWGDMEGTCNDKND